MGQLRKDAKIVGREPGGLPSGPASSLVATSGRSLRGPLLAAAVLAAASLAVLPWDRTMSQFSVHESCPAAVEKSLQLCEVFGHGLGVLLIALVVFQLDPLRRWAVPRLILVAIGSGVAADLVKVVVARARPRAGDLQDCVGTVVHGWFSRSEGIHGQSFPSGHVAAAVGLAFVLTALYPRGRWIFFGLALVSACQRLQEAAHYPSDCLFGAAVGCLLAAVCLYRNPIARLIDHREAGLRAWAERRPWAARNARLPRQGDESRTPGLPA